MYLNIYILFKWSLNAYLNDKIYQYDNYVCGIMRWRNYYYNTMIHVDDEPSIWVLTNGL